MKQISGLLIVMIISCSSIVFGQHSSINGIVSIYNSQTETKIRHYVPNAEIIDDFETAQHTFTDEKGRFKLIFYKVNENETVSFKVEKRGLEVVNFSDLRAVAGQKDTVRIGMATPQYVSQYRMKLYNISKFEATKRLDILIANQEKKIEFYRSQHLNDSTAISVLIEEKKQYENDKLNIDVQSRELARTYALINLDDASPLFKETFVLFKEGYLDSALLILKNVDLANLVERVLESRAEIAKLEQSVGKSVQEITEALQFKADLHKTRFEIDSAINCYRLLLLLDSTNQKSLFEYAFYLKQINQRDSAIVYYQNALANSKSIVVKGDIYNNLGVIYKEKFDSLKGQYFLNQAIAVRNQLYNLDRRRFAHDLVVSLDNLGTYYVETNQFNAAQMIYNKVSSICDRMRRDSCPDYDEAASGSEFAIGLFFSKENEYSNAETHYLNAMNIYRKLVKQNPVFQPELARVLLQVSFMYAEKGDFGSQFSFVEQASEIFGRLSLGSPRLFNLEKAECDYGFGLYYMKHNDFKKSELNFSNALGIYKVLDQVDKESFKPEYGLILKEYGNLCLERRDANKALSYFGQSLEILKTLYARDSNRFALDYASILYDLGNCLRYNDNILIINNAKEFYFSALKIYHRLSTIDINVFSIYVARTEGSLGVIYNALTVYDSATFFYNKSLLKYYALKQKTFFLFTDEISNLLTGIGDNYLDAHDYKGARKAYDSSILLYRQLSAKNKSVFEPKLSNSLNNIGICLMELGLTEKARSSYNEALSIRAYWAGVDQDRFEPDLAMTSMNMGILLSKSGKSDDAIGFFEKAVKLNRRLSKKFLTVYGINLVMTLRMLGSEYIKVKKLSLADSSYTEAIRTLFSFPYPTENVNSGDGNPSYRL